MLLEFGAKLSIDREKRLVTSPKKVPRLHLPHAMVVRLHAHEVSVVSLTPLTVGLIGWPVGFSIQDKAMDVHAWSRMMLSNSKLRRECGAYDTPVKPKTSRFPTFTL